MGRSLVKQVTVEFQLTVNSTLTGDKFELKIPEAATVQKLD
jgi:outer membrane lipoprotein-sorting protein